MEYLGWALFGLMVFLWIRTARKYLATSRREQSLNGRQQRLFREIETLKGEKQELADSLDKVQEQLRTRWRDQTRQRRIRT